MPYIINGQTIDDDALYEEFDRVKAAFQQGPVPVNCCERDDEFMGYARENLISRTLLMQEARKRDLDVPDEEIDAALVQLKEAHGGEEWFYVNTNTSKDQEDQVKENLALDLKVQKLIDEACGPAEPPGEEDIEQYYQDHIDDFTTAEQVHVLHLTKNLDHGEDRVEAFKHLMEARGKLLDEGAEFADLVETYSDRPEENGDLGFFERGSLVEEFETVVFSLREGEISPVFMSAFGYHVAKLVGRKPPTPKPLDEVREEVVERIQIERREQAARQFVDELKSKSEIEVIEEQEQEA